MGIRVFSLLVFACFLAAGCLGASISGNATFDYVIVGGGTSGLAIASRLAEDPSVSVAVVEAGGYYEVEGGFMSVIPGFAGAASTGTSPLDSLSLIDWNFNTLPLKEGFDRRLRYARGKTVGGSSARNFMVYQRGTKDSFNQWADIVGDDSWTWDAALPFFEKSCTLTPPNMSMRAANSSVTYDATAFDNSLNGPLQVSWPNYGSPFSTHVEIGLEKIGIQPGSDFNGGSLNGSSWAATTISPEDQARSSSETSFLKRATDETSIKVYTHTLAKRIVFDQSTSTATGVKIETKGKTFTLTSRKEVILSAGVFQSPQLLMASGIGPKQTLERHGIPIIQDLPGVGQNLWDHVIFGVVHRVDVITASNFVVHPLSAVEALADYTFRKSGPLTAPGFGVIGWEKVPAVLRREFKNTTLDALGQFPDDWPEIEYIGLDGILDGWHSALDQVLLDGQQYATIAAALVAPLSRGTVTIASSDVSTPPLIDLGYLTHPADQEVAIAAVKRLRQTWAGIEVALGEYKPGAEVQTDEEILEFIRSTMVPVWHAAGTCAMGNPSNRNSVVDSNAKVIGVNHLRVVDASIFPTLPPGHPQSACYMVAEKIAAAMKEGK
ncbi:GMC family oxidoreductase [Aspergillus lucknowensis]|uniref:Glucose-methanol-choline oxidoreductase N-terminal domain-containing protein n=1 Tax=Aspergillus lucknowensis TaxID=176173 RepID=A0ABR4M7S6_9EURO